MTDITDTSSQGSELRMLHDTNARRFFARRLSKPHGPLRYRPFDGAFVDRPRDPRREVVREPRLVNQSATHREPVAHDASVQGSVQPTS